MLTSAKSATAPIPAELPRLVDNPSPLHISDMICDVLPLNYKQKRTISIIFYHTLRFHGKPAIEEVLLDMGGKAVQVPHHRRGEAGYEAAGTREGALCYC